MQTIIQIYPCLLKSSRKQDTIFEVFSIYELNTPKYLTIFLVKAEVIIFMCRDVEDAGETQGSVEHHTKYVHI
jgi:hypothetical protein